MVNNLILTGMSWFAAGMGSLKGRIESERGQDLIEYAVLAGAIAIVAAVALLITGPGTMATAFGTFKSKVIACVAFDNSATGCGH